jgi:hypothetical protein
MWGNCGSRVLGHAIRFTFGCVVGVAQPGCFIGPAVVAEPVKERYRVTAVS